MKIYSADLWPPPRNDESYGEAAERALTNGQVRVKQFIENSLLYDQVVIPTDNFVALLFLSRAFGPETIATLIDEGALRFNRFIGQLAFAGGDTGLSVVKLAIDETLRAKGKISAAWLPTGVLTTGILRDMCGVDPRRAKQISAKIVSATKETDLTALQKRIRERTAFVAKSPEAGTLMIHASDLARIRIDADKVQLLGEMTATDQTDVAKLLTIARTQQELIARQEAECEDLSTLSPVGKILAPSVDAGTSLGRLYQISDVPDIGAATMRGDLSIEQILKLRASRNWIEFKRWFHETCASDPSRVAREYVKLLKADRPLDTPYFKTVRLFITTVIGAFSPLAGIAAAAADTFVVPKLKEQSAKYFIEYLEQLNPDQTR